MMDYNKEFAELAKDRMMLKELEALVKEREDRIKEQMLADGKDVIIGTEHKVSFKEEIRRTFDSKAFKADGYAELYEAYRKPSAQRRFIFA